MNILALPKKNIVFLTFCGLGFLGIFLITLYANYRSLDRIEKNIKELKAKIESQKTFSPIFQELFKEIQFKPPEGLPFPEPKKLAREGTGKIATILQKVVNQSGLKIAEIVPDVDSSIDGSEHLMVNMVMLGELPQFRKLLFELGALPYLKHIGQIQIKTVEDAREFRLKVWMAKEE
jgi:hypothetical protein